MSDLDEAMMEYMANIIFSEHRPFSFRDFLRFEVDGNEHHMTAGTFRNKIAKLRKLGEVELAYNSGTAFYTLRGHRFANPMTPNRLGVNSANHDPVLRLIQNLPTDKNAVHDIRLRFEVNGIWEFLSRYYPELLVHHNSKDILIPTWSIGGLLIRVTIHRTNTVSVLVACSLAPIATDISGVIRLSNALTRTEERLATLITKAGTTNDIYGAIACKERNGTHLIIPDHASWIITMWHFGVDSLVEYSGDKFSVTLEVGENALVRAYTKIMKDKKTRIRLERQEYPNATLERAILEKLSAGGLASS